MSRSLPNGRIPPGRVTMYAVVYLGSAAAVITGIAAIIWTLAT
jgi:hypothetical protein